MSGPLSAVARASRRVSASTQSTLVRVAVPGSVWAQRTSRTRSEIVEAAMTCFDEAGFDATTIAQITERAEVARRTFFRYFPTKEAVLFSDFTTRQDHVLELVLARPLEESPLESVLSALKEMSMTPPDAGRVRRIQRIVRASPSLLERERSLVQYGFADRLIVTLGARLQAAGARELSPLQLRVMVGSALLCYESAVMSHVVGGTGPLTMIFDEAVVACRDSWAAQGVAMP